MSEGKTYLDPLLKKAYTPSNPFEPRGDQSKVFNRLGNMEKDIQEIKEMVKNMKRSDQLTLLNGIWR